MDDKLKKIIKEKISKEVSEILNEESFTDRLRAFGNRNLAKKLFGKNGDIKELNKEPEVDVTKLIYDLFSEVIEKSGNEANEVITIFDTDIVDKTDCNVNFYFDVKVNVDAFGEDLSTTDEQRISQMVINHIASKANIQEFNTGDGKIFVKGNATGDIC